MTHASLFSGIGAAELAAAWMGWKNLFHCEIDGFCNKILDYWFNDSIAYGDIRKTDFTPWRGKVDVLTGGFPCQPFSVAGSRKGTEDDRYLFPEMLRAISEIRPTWVVGENVAGLITMVQPGSEAKVAAETGIFGKNIVYRKKERYVLFDIISSLEGLEYEVQPFVIPACAVGAPHRRERIWIVAHRADTRPENQQKRTVVADTVGTTPHTDCDRLRIRPGQPITQRWSERPPDACCTREADFTSDITADTWGNGRHAFTYDSGHTESAQQAKVKPFGADCPQDWWRGFPSVSSVCSRNDGLSFDVDSLAISFSQWRRQSIKAYGNSMVPQVIFEIISAIADVSG